MARRRKVRLRGVAPDRPGGPARLASRAGLKVKEAVATVFELPREVILDLPRLTLIGNLQLTVENHRGLMEYTPERICIAVHAGRLEITGQGLRIGSVYREELIVTGRIEAVRHGS